LTLAGVLAFLGQRRDHRADLHAFGAFGHGDLGDHAFVDRLELHRRLVGLDLGHDVARAHLVADLDQPLESVPSSIVGDRAGIWMAIDMRGVVSSRAADAQPV
jgi:hypothetical protein